jgi:hypothetical protein
MALSDIFRKREKIDYEQYKPDPLEYREEYQIYLDQPLSVKKELRAIKICMMVLIPLFSLLGFFFLYISIITGIVCAAVCFIYLYHTISVKVATASVVSIAAGVLFGHFIFNDIYKQILAFRGGI